MMVVIGGRIENEEKNIRQTIRGGCQFDEGKYVAVGDRIEVVYFGSVKYSQ